jgi:hypothetical protein
MFTGIRVFSRGRGAIKRFSAHVSKFNEMNPNQSVTMGWPREKGKSEGEIKTVKTFIVKGLWA